MLRLKEGQRDISYIRYFHTISNENCLKTLKKIKKIIINKVNTNFEFYFLNFFTKNRKSQQCVRWARRRHHTLAKDRRLYKDQAIARESPAVELRIGSDNNIVERFGIDSRVNSYCLLQCDFFFFIDLLLNPQEFIIPLHSHIDHLASMSTTLNTQISKTKKGLCSAEEGRESVCPKTKIRIIASLNV